METYLERASYDWSNDSIRHINTPGKTARQLFFYVQEIGYFKTHPPYFTERANLDSYLIIFTISGTGELFYNGQEYSLTPNTLCYLNCNEHHLYRCAKDSNWEFLWLHFKGSTARGYYEEFAHNGFHILLPHKPDFIEDTLKQLLYTIKKREVHSELLASKLITDLLTEILLHNTDTGERLPHIPKTVSDIMQQIEHHFADALTLDDLAKISHLSKYHMEREFKKYTGTSIHEYLILTRINHAKELLQYSDKTIEEISFSCGMSNVSHFIRLFKKHEKLTPLQYRKKWQEPY